MTQITMKPLMLALTLLSVSQAAFGMPYTSVASPLLSSADLPWSQVVNGDFSTGDLTGWVLDFSTTIPGATADVKNGAFTVEFTPTEVGQFIQAMLRQEPVFDRGGVLTYDRTASLHGLTGKVYTPVGPIYSLTNAAGDLTLNGSWTKSFAPDVTQTGNNDGVLKFDLFVLAAAPSIGVPQTFTLDNFHFTPVVVPEPSTFVLLAIAALSVVGVKRRR